jgi:hypothetical protein
LVISASERRIARDLALSFPEKTPGFSEILSKNHSLMNHSDTALDIEALVGH